MSRKAQNQTYEYAGAGWVGEVYSEGSEWAWYLSVDVDQYRGFAKMCHGFTTKAAAERSMMARLKLLIPDGNNCQLGFPVAY